MQGRTVISYLPGNAKKNGSKKNKIRKVSLWSRFSHLIKAFFILFFLLIYLIYTNQSSTLGYGLRKSLNDLEKTQEQYDAIQLLVSQKEQELWSKVERQPSKKGIKKIIID